jgi:hypothetical protein
MKIVYGLINYFMKLTDNHYNQITPKLDYLLLS